MNEINLQNQNGLILVSSREIAERFEKQHKHILDKISLLILEINSAEKSAQYFFETKYADLSGKSNKEYLLNRDGFSLLVMGFTGNRALAWKLKYINAFNRMEEEIRKQSSLLPKTYKEALIQLVEQVEQNELLLEEKKRNEPLVQFAEQVTKSVNDIDMGQFAKIIKDENINIGRNRLFEWLRNQKVLMANNTPYQKYIDKKWFNVIETLIPTPYGDKCFPKTLITGLGQVQIVERLRAEFNNQST